MEGLWFYAKILQVAFAHALDIAQAVIFTAVILIGVCAYFLPGARMALDLTSWQVATGVLGAIIVTRLVLAPYWIWKTVNDEVKRLTQLQFPNIKLSFDATREIVVGPCDTTHHYWQVLVKNIGTSQLEDCQLQIRCDGELSPITVTLPFKVRPLETVPWGFLKTFPYEKERAAAIDHYFFGGNQWRPHPSRIVLNGKCHLIEIEALAANSTPTRLKVLLLRENEHWIMKNADIR